MLSYRRIRDRWNRGIFVFKMLFDSSRYDFPFPRYRRVKRKVFFSIAQSDFGTRASPLSETLDNAISGRKYTFLEKNNLFKPRLGIPESRQWNESKNRQFRRINSKKSLTVSLNGGRSRSRSRTILDSSAPPFVFSIFSSPPVAFDLGRVRGRR